MGESNDIVARKFAAAQAAELTPILCVGETLEERQADSTTAVISSQFSSVVDAVGIEAFANAVVAYEPVWAIGTGVTASDQQAQDAHAFCRSVISDIFDNEVAQAVRIQYGGSVKAENTVELLSQPDIDGALVGGAALKVDSFSGIIKNAAGIQK